MGLLPLSPLWSLSRLPGPVPWSEGFPVLQHCLALQYPVAGLPPGQMFTAFLDPPPGLRVRNRPKDCHYARARGVPYASSLAVLRLSLRACSNFKLVLASVVSKDYWLAGVSKCLRRFWADAKCVPCPESPLPFSPWSGEALLVLSLIALS